MMRLRSIILLVCICTMPMVSHGDNLGLASSRSDLKPITQTPAYKLDQSVLLDDGTTTYAVTVLRNAVDQDGNPVTIKYATKQMTAEQIQGKIDQAQAQVDYWQGVMDSATALPVTEQPVKEQP